MKLIGRLAAITLAFGGFERKIEENGMKILKRDIALIFFIESGFRARSTSQSP